MAHTATHDEPRWAGLTEVIRMSAPIIAGTISYAAMQFVDQVMVSRLGTDALAAVGSSGLWVFGIAAFIMGVVSCVSTFVAQSLGRGNKEDCARYTWQGMYMSIAMGAVVLALWPAAPRLFALMHHEPEVTRLEVGYFQVRLIGYLFIAGQAALLSFFTAVNNPVVPLIAVLFSNALNLVLNFALIYGMWGFPRWEVRGAAAATVIALGAQVLILTVVFLHRRWDREFGTRHARRLDWVKIWELFRIGWAGGITWLLDILTWGIFTSFIVGGFGKVQLASHNVAFNFMQLAFMPLVGMNYALGAIVGQWIGRGDIARAKARTYTTLKLASIYMACISISFCLFGRVLIRTCFSVDPAVVELGRVLLLFVVVFQTFDSIRIISFGALRGAGDTHFTAIVTSSLAYLVFLPVACVLGSALARWTGDASAGAIGAWMGAALYSVLLCMALFWRFHRESWRHIKIFTCDRVAAEGAALDGQDHTQGMAEADLDPPERN